MGVDLVLREVDLDGEWQSTVAVQAVEEREWKKREVFVSPQLICPSLVLHLIYSLH
jgi:hypothetical protein